MNERDRETLAFLSGNRLRAMPERDQRSDFVNVDRADRVDWHAVAARQTLSGSNHVSVTQRAYGWERPDAPELQTNIAWDARSLRQQGVVTD